MAFKAGLIMALLAGAVGCASAPEKPWLKPGPYTTEEFRRDTAACTKDGSLDEACMQAKGWVTVNPGKPEPVKPKKPDPSTPRY